MTTLTLNFTVSSCELNGDLTRDTVATIANKKFKSLFSQQSAELDLTHIVKVDSAGLAWLLSLVELAGKSACKLNFTHSPQGLLKLAKLSAVDSFLPID
ncbi:lipid asymmetry maintenance protein MlaB [Colwelliaceae bacterium 6471]